MYSKYWEKKPIPHCSDAPDALSELVSRAQRGKGVLAQWRGELRSSTQRLSNKVR